MPQTRRDFLQTTATLGAGLGLSMGTREARAAAPQTDPDPRRSDPGPRPLKLLILGGTGFLGPHTVEAALSRGHEVTLFNRGRTNPGLFAELEKLRGDRDPDKGDGLSALEGRRWDGVIDTSGYFPRMVGATAQLLADQVEQYVFISSISVYADQSTPHADESAAIVEMEDPTLEEFGDQFQHYGPLKALCERAAEQAMPGRVTNIRPGLIVGPLDNVPRFTYWPVRIERGGEVLAPGSPDDPVQYIDGRDLADFVILSIEEKVTGVYNATGPEVPTTIAELLYGCKAVTGGPVTFTWVDADFLAEQGVQGWSDMPLWVPPVGDVRGINTTDCSRAIRAGLAFRPLAETVRATLEWYHGWPPERPFPWRGGIPPEREAGVLKAWHARR